MAAVPVQSGRATVDLTVRALAADAVLRRAMWAQFLSTLLQVQLPAVNEVSLRVDGAQLDLPGLGATTVGLRGRHQAANVSVADATLETLAIIAYRQPLTRARIGT